ncbi:MAG TPA: methyltransferase domain-containing protein [Anaerolineae bacterium]|nr:methyltransferase domain-containing protein [Anaerolineae bacterium]
MKPRANGVWPWIAGLAAGAAVAGGWQVYRRRPRERSAGFEGLDDPEVARAFGRIARLPQFWLLRRIAIRRALALKREGHAADLGCGPGDLVLELAKREPALRVTGIDLSPEMLAQAAARAEGAGMGDRVDFWPGDAQSIPFPDGSLDLVVSTLSLHHWSAPVAAFDEIARVMRPGGAFVIFDLRRDLAAPFYLLIWFATNVVVPAALRRVNEPLGSRNASYTPQEAAALLAQSRLRGWRVTHGPLWLTLEGIKPPSSVV